MTTTLSFIRELYSQPPRFPSLIRGTNQRDRIPYPKDFDLEELVDAVMTRYEQDDFVCADNVRGQVWSILILPEQDKAAIQSRQEVLGYFRENPALRTFVLSEQVPELDNDHTFWGYGGHHEFYDFERMYKDHRSRALAYRNVVQGLAQQMPPSSNPEIENFRAHLQRLMDTPRFRELDTLIKDEQRSVRVVLDIHYNEYLRQRKWSSEYVSVQLPDAASIEVTHVSSGKKLKFKDSLEKDKYERPSFSLPLGYQNIVANVVEQLRGNKPKIKVPVDISITIRLELYEAIREAYATVKYQRKRFFRASETIEQRVKVNYDALVKDWHGEDQIAQRYAHPVRVRTLNNFFESFSMDIENLRSAATELRYFATVAQYFEGMKEKGFKTTTPQILSGESPTLLDRVVHPLMAEKKEPAEIVENNFVARPEVNVMVISGPNANSKTVFEDSIIYAHLMAQAGWDVFARQADITPVDTVYTQRIQKGDIIAGESRHTHELGRTRYIVDNATSRSLVVIDEPFSGTKPEDGATLANALIKAMGVLGATTILATHYERVPEFAATQPYARNFQAEIQVEDGKLIPTYKIIPGISRISNGVYLASQMSVDEKGLLRILGERASRGEVALRRVS